MVVGAWRKYDQQGDETLPASLWGDTTNRMMTYLVVLCALAE